MTISKPGNDYDVSNWLIIEATISYLSPETIELTILITRVLM